jgi:hypothetical protein
MSVVKVNHFLFGLRLKLSCKKSTVIWVIMPCSLEEHNCLHIQVLKVSQANSRLWVYALLFTPKDGGKMFPSTSMHACLAHHMELQGILM